MRNRLQLTRRSAGPSRALTIDVERAWNGGYAGRDEESVREHVRELAALGIAAPAVTPIWFPLANHLVTTATGIQVTGAETSGEIEYALVMTGDEVLVTVASDHSDRAFERYDVQASKQLCPNVIATEAWPLGECHDHWDELRLRCWVTAGGERRLYQEAPLAGLLAASRWLELLEADGLAGPGLVFLSGTPATLGGFVYGDAYELELADPVLGRAIRHTYAVEVLGRGHQ